MINYFDYIASIYDRLDIHPDPSRLHLLLALPADGPLLDAAGGTGRVSLSLRSLVGAVVISDLSHQMLRQAKKKGFSLTVQARTERLPFLDAIFSRVLVVDALHHFTDQHAAVAELSRVLKPEGRIVIVEPDVTRFPAKVASLVERWMFMGSRFHPAGEIANMLSGQGLSAFIASRDSFRVWIAADKK